MSDEMKIERNAAGSISMHMWPSGFPKEYIRLKRMRSGIFGRPGISFKSESSGGMVGMFLDRERALTLAHELLKMVSDMDEKEGDDG